MSLMQWVLDFCADAPMPVPPGSAPAAQETTPKVPPTQERKAPAAPEKRAVPEPAPGVHGKPPAMPGPAATAPVSSGHALPGGSGASPDPECSAAAAPALQQFRHPEARRELLLEQGRVLVAYALERVRRRSIGFTVSAAGLAVRAPTRLPLEAVDDAVRRKAGWIVRKLHDTRMRAARQACSATVWQDGAVLPYLGTVLRVCIDAAAPAAGVLLAPADGAPGLELRIRVPAPRTPRTPRMQALPDPPHTPVSATDLHAAALRRAVHAWMLRQARAHFSARLDHFAPLLGVQWQRLALTNARTRWGSAKSDGSIRLNWRLMHCEPEVLDYVVAHELAHLRVMDHSPRFWATVATVVPDHAALRRRLREAAVPRWAP